MLSAVVGFTLSHVLLVEPKWEPLFDGKSLDGWVQRGGSASYTVNDGVIVGETRPNTPNSFLCTKKRYTDFVLELEFRVDNELNSGIQVRSNSVLGYKKGVVHGYQCEIDPSERSYTGGIYDESRRGVFLADLAKNEAGRKALKRGDWNRYRIECRGDRMRTWVNGVPCADLRDDVTRTGFIGLQVHSVGNRQDPLKVEWRDIKIQDFGDPYAEVPTAGKRILGQGGDTINWKMFGSKDSPIGWKYDGSVATVLPGGGEIETRAPHGDALIYVEFNTDDNGLTGQANGNSGVYMQGRYEVQVLNSASEEPADNLCGGIYGVKKPDFNMAFAAGEWQNYWIKFTAARWEGEKKISNARMTVYHNGTLIHNDIEVPNFTTAGSPEAPFNSGLKLQNHGNRVRYRTVWIQPL